MIHQMSGVDRVLVEKVSGPMPTRHPHVSQYLIDAQLADANVHVQYETVNPLRASLCDRYAGSQQALSVRWRRSPYGKEVQAVEVA